MNKQTWRGVMLGMIALFALAAGQLTADAAPPAADVIKLAGQFEWAGQRGTNHDLQATLTPAGEGRWSVTWKFDWKGKPTTYIGFITGDLQDGTVTGTGDDARTKRTFSFEGTAKAGVWSIKCFETTRGTHKPQGDGTITVQP